MESHELRALVADTLHQDRLATAAARRPTTTTPVKRPGQPVHVRAHWLPAGLLLLVTTLIRPVMT